MLENAKKVKILGCLLRLTINIYYCIANHCWSVSKYLFLFYLYLFHLFLKKKIIQRAEKQYKQNNQHIARCFLLLHSSGVPTMSHVLQTRCLTFLGIHNRNWSLSQHNLFSTLLYFPNINSKCNKRHLTSCSNTLGFLQLTILRHSTI